eukprot:gene24855-10515_t
MREYFPSILALTCLLLAACSSASSFPTDVVLLTDADFEHATQASTGQTTGIWCILFVERSDPNYASAHAMWELLASDEEKEVIYAEVDMDVNLELAWRFGQSAPWPKAILLRDRVMFEYDVATDSTDGHESVMGLVAEGYTLLICFAIIFSITSAPDPPPAPKTAAPTSAPKATPKSAPKVAPSKSKSAAVSKAADEDATAKKTDSGSDEDEDEVPQPKKGRKKAARM